VANPSEDPMTPTQAPAQTAYLTRSTSPPQEPGLPAIPGISLLTSRRRSAAAPIGHAPPPQAGGPFADPVGG
jgi:hypothetical protein